MELAERIVWALVGTLSAIVAILAGAMVSRWWHEAFRKIEGREDE